MSRFTAYIQGRFLNVSCIEFASLYEFFYWILQLFWVWRYERGVILCVSFYYIYLPVINCKDHDMKYTHFCQVHDKPSCPDCISTNQKDCVGLLSIREIIKTSKTSTLVDDIEQGLTNIKYNMISSTPWNFVMVLTGSA
jgi:hypothetical protein